MAANKITESISLKLVSPGGTDSLSGSVVLDQIGSNFVKETQLITTADAIALDIPADIVNGKLGYLMIRNLAPIAVPPVDPAAEAYVDIALDEPMVNKIATIRPGKGAYIPPPGGVTALWGQANGADVQIIFFAIES